MGLRIVCISAALACGLFCAAGTQPARAQHVVTDMEAGKLTLDALTATPRPIYRPIVAFRRVHGYGSVGRAAHFHYASYRRRAGSRYRRH